MTWSGHGLCQKESGVREADFAKVMHFFFFSAFKKAVTSVPSAQGTGRDCTGEDGVQIMDVTADTAGRDCIWLVAEGVNSKQEELKVVRVAEEEKETKGGEGELQGILIGGGGTDRNAGACAFESTQNPQMEPTVATPLKDRISRQYPETEDSKGQMDTSGTASVATCMYPPPHQMDTSVTASVASVTIITAVQYPPHRGSRSLYAQAEGTAQWSAPASPLAHADEENSCEDAVRGREEQLAKAPVGLGDTCMYPPPHLLNLPRARVRDEDNGDSGSDANVDGGAEDNEFEQNVSEDEPEVRQPPTRDSFARDLRQEASQQDGEDFQWQRDGQDLCRLAGGEEKELDSGNVRLSIAPSGLSLFDSLSAVTRRYRSQDYRSEDLNVFDSENSDLGLIEVETGEDIVLQSPLDKMLCERAVLLRMDKGQQVCCVFECVCLCVCVCVCVCVCKASQS